MNLLHKREGEHQGLIADAITELIESNFEDRAAVAERLLRFSIWTLLADDEPHTILEVKKLIDDDQFRRKLLNKLQRDPANYEIIDYWETDGPGNMKTSVMAVKNRIDIFSISPILKRSFGQLDMSLDIRKFMEEDYIVLFDISGLNDIELSIISGYLSFMYYRIAETRSTYPLMHLLCFDETARVGYVSTLEKIIAESRKFGLALGVSTQRLGQLSDGLRDSLVNVQDDYFILQQGAEDAPLALKFLNQERDQTYKVDFLTGMKQRHAFIMAKDEINGVVKKYNCLVEVDPLDKYKPDLTVAKHNTHETDIADALTLEKANELTTKIGRSIEEIDYEIMKYMNPNFDFTEYEKRTAKQSEKEHKDKNVNESKKQHQEPDPKVEYVNGVPRYDIHHFKKLVNEQKKRSEVEFPESEMNIEETYKKLDPIEIDQVFKNNEREFFEKSDTSEKKSLKIQEKEGDKKERVSLMDLAKRSAEELEGDDK